MEDDLDDMLADLGMGDPPAKKDSRNPRLSGLASASPQHFTQAANKNDEGLDDWGFGATDNKAQPGHLKSVGMANA